MSDAYATHASLDAAQVRQFVEHGFVRIDRAVPSHLVEQVADRLWADMSVDPDAPETWSRPVVRMGMYPDPPFVAAANTEVLHGAFDRLVGAGRWLRCGSLGTFRCAFPSSEVPADLGWHVDASFGYEDPDFMKWRANVGSRGRTLLMLLLFTDVGTADAPTRLRVGSHQLVARQLAHAGDDGLTLGELAAGDFGNSTTCPIALATGGAGTVYLCHPFLVHAASQHHGRRPRLIAQPPLLPTQPDWSDLVRHPLSPVEEAIRRALDG